MTKLNKNMTDGKFLIMLENMDDYDLIEAMQEVAPELNIEETDMLLDSLQDDIPTLLDYQSNLDEVITDYKFIKTGTYYYEITVSDTVFELLADLDWLSYKDELIEWFNTNEF